MREKDPQCINLLARHKNMTPDEMWEVLSKWKYDYNTATYFLMLNRKRRELPVRLYGPGATPFRNYRNTVSITLSLHLSETIFNYIQMKIFHCNEVSPKLTIFFFADKLQCCSLYLMSLTIRNLIKFLWMLTTPRRILLPSKGQL